MRRGERGTAVIEWILCMGLMILPMTGLLTVIAWPSRLNAASAAAYQAAKAAAEAPNPAAGEDLGRQRAADVLANHGFDPSSASVTFNVADPGRGDAVQATVTIDLPALRFPGIGSWDAVSAARTSTVNVPDYGSLS